jgi:hypothetical protein
MAKGKVASLSDSEEELLLTLEWFLCTQALEEMVSDAQSVGDRR